MSNDAASNPLFNAGLLVLDATRRMLEAANRAKAVAESREGPLVGSGMEPLTVMSEILASSDWNSMTQYQAIAMLSALIMWMSAETNRPQESILDELGKNYGRSSPAPTPPSGI